MMKENIQSRGQEIGIVIYDAPLPPKYFRFSRTFIRSMFVVVPIALTLIFLGLFFWGLATRIKETPVPTIPEVISQGDSELISLQNEVRALKQSNAEMTEKLATQPAVMSAEDPYLMGIKKPYGMQNLLSQNKATLDQFELSQDPNKVALKFQIISSNPETRVTGHVLVFMVSEAGVTAWPKEANAALGSGIKYSLGEPFAVSRLRPTSTEFLVHPVGESVRFVVYIFSREGDLLLIKETDSFKIGAKP